MGILRLILQLVLLPFRFVCYLASMPTYGCPGRYTRHRRSRNW